MTDQVLRVEREGVKNAFEGNLNVRLNGKCQLLKSTNI